MEKLILGPGGLERRPSPGKGWPVIWRSATRGDHIHRCTGGRTIGHISPRHGQSRSRHNRAGNPLRKRLETVQANQTTSPSGGAKARDRRARSGLGRCRSASGRPRGSDGRGHQGARRRWRPATDPRHAPRHPVPGGGSHALRDGRHPAMPSGREAPTPSPVWKPPPSRDRMATVDRASATTVRTRQ